MSIEDQIVELYRSGLSMRRVAEWLDTNPRRVHEVLHGRDEEIRSVSDYHDPPAKRFWNLVRLAGHGECWEWLGAVGGSGYGRFNIGQNNLEGAHRFSYWLSNGELPEGKHVCHTCDNKLCVNPSHLWLGDAQANSQDMVEKERGPKQKLTTEEAREVKRLYNETDTPRYEIAERFDICGNSVYNIGNGITWTHLE